MEVSATSYQGMAPDSPSGIGFDNGGQTNAPIAAITGTDNPSVVNNTDSGSTKNSPPGPPKFKWEKYGFLYNCYYGLGGFYDGTALRKSKVEIDDQYLDRRATTHFRNYYRPIVDSTYIPVFSENATRKTEVNGTLDEDGARAPLWNAFIDDCDNRKHHIEEFTKKIIKHARMLGVCFVVVDNFPQVDKAGMPLLSMSQDEALINRIFPYVYMRLPQQVEPSTVKLDPFGKIIEIAFREQPAIIKDEHTGEPKKEERWKKWTAQYSVMLRKSERTNELDEIGSTRIKYDIGEVPIIPVMSSEGTDDTVLPHPPMYSIADCNLSIFNIDSYQMRLVRAQLFPILCLPMDKQNNPVKVQSVSVTQAFVLPPDTQEAKFPLPFYLSPNVGPYQELTNTIEMLREDIYRLAGQHGVTGNLVKGQQSGVAKAYDFQAQGWVLKETAKMARKCEEEIARIFQLYVTSEVFEYEAIYEEDYSAIDLQSDVQLYSDYLALQPPPKAKALALEMVSRSLFNDVEDEDLQPVINEIKDTANEKEVNIPSPEELLNAMVKGQSQPDEQLDTTQQNTFPQKKVAKISKKRFSVRNSKGVVE